MDAMRFKHTLVTNAALSSEITAEKESIVSR